MATDKPTIKLQDKKAQGRLEYYRQAYLQSIPEDNFDQALWQAVKIVSATVDADGKTGKAVYTLTAPERYVNYTGNLMGGATSTIMDGLTNCTVALIAGKGTWHLSGVTTNFHINYLRPVSKGQTVEVECNIMSSSDRRVTIQGVMKRLEDGKILTIAVQEMVAAGSPASRNATPTMAKL